jgi:Glycosyl transferase 4-like domain
MTFSSARTVLIVSPHFPPVNAPDHQRVRMALPYLHEFGWKAHVLAVHPDYVEGAKDDLLEQTIPDRLSLTRTSALPARRTRLAGVGDLGLRSMSYLRNAGGQILKEEKIDLVYFSTTVFNVLALGPGWERRFGVPYALDFQDPWLSDYYSNGNSVAPPGGRFKYGVSQLLARKLEPYSLRHAAHITSVSPAYRNTLRQRYDWLEEDRFTVLPFGASEKDFETVTKLNVKQTVFDKADGKRHWVYLGRGGPDMAVALRGFFTALRDARIRGAQHFADLQIHFVGTDYAPAERARKTVEPIAIECGVGDLVVEQTSRVSYFEALQCLNEAEALLVVGSDDPGYTASKIYPYVMARKPLLAVLHESSNAVEVLKSTRSATVVTFDSATDVQLLASAVGAAWFDSASLPEVETDWQAFSIYTAREMTRRLCAVFDQCVGARQRNSNGHG